VVRVFNVLNAELEPEKEYQPGFQRASTRVGDAVGGDRIGATLYELGDEERVCPYHYHHGVEEWLYVVSGTPVLRRPDGERALRAGDVVCFAGDPSGAHDVRGPARVLILSANRWPAVVVYPDSDKLGTRPTREFEDADRLNFRRDDAVDYWLGEE
jgi:uncharacterized cupin superfamily protein